MLLFIIKTAKGSKAANLVVTGCAVKPCHPYPALAVSGQGPPSRPSRRASGVGRWHPLANQGGQGGQNFAPIGRLAFVSCPGTIPTNGASPLCGVGGPCSNVQAITASGFMLGHTPHFWDFLTTGERLGLPTCSELSGRFTPLSAVLRKSLTLDFLSSFNQYIYNELRRHVKCAPDRRPRI